MAALSNTEAASLLNESLRSGTVYIGLFLTDPTAGATGQEANGGGYARKVITFGVPSLSAANSRYLIPLQLAGPHLLLILALLVIGLFLMLHLAVIKNGKGRSARAN